VANKIRVITGVISSHSPSLSQAAEDVRQHS
jgi:hypothetical protein